MTPTLTDLEKLRIDRGDSPGARGTGPMPGAGAPPRAPRRVRGSGLARWLGPLVAILVVLVFVVGVFGRRLPEVRVAPVEVEGGTGSGTITANGYVVARTKASVSAKILGRLASLEVAEGSHLTKGEILARIESADYAAALKAAQAEVRQLEAELAQAQDDLARATELAGRGVIARTDLQNAQTRVRAGEAAVEAARARAALAAANLENTNVRAPFDGTVLRKDAEVGEIVAPSSAGGGLTRTAIVTMADLATLEVEVDVNEAYIARVSNGQAARITLDAYPDTSFAGRVRQVVPTADRQKATVLVKVAITDRDPRILPEMGARVDFVPAGQEQAAAEPRRVWAPAAAVDASGGAPRIWVLNGDKVEPTEVVTGASRDGRVEVKSGLSGEETVVVSPPAKLKAGTRVRVAKG